MKDYVRLLSLVISTAKLHTIESINLVNNVYYEEIHKLKEHDTESYELYF